MPGRAMLHDLRSFRNDWERWSAGERLASKVILAAVALTVAGTVLIEVSGSI